ncbi:MAG: porin, partial [Longimicrobiales bacterium]|nr:porin [Longimicrobiales bacterium]
DAALSDGVAVRMGQFKKPFGLFELTSNTKILTIERAVRIRGLDDLVGVPGEAQFLLDESAYLGRQIGVMVHGEAGGVGFAGGVFNGEGTNTRETEASKAWAARLSYGIGEDLVVGGAVSVQPTGQFDVNGDEIAATAFAVDAEYGEFRGDGLHVMAEAMVGDNPLLLVGDEPPTMVGLQAVAAWFSPLDGRIEGWEPVLRVSWADPDTGIDSDEGTLITPGVSLYFSGRNRLMVNADAYLPAASGLDTEYSLVAQFQIYF